MKVGRFLWLAFLVILIVFVVFAAVTNVDYIRDGFQRLQRGIRQLPETFRELLRSEIIILVGIWLFIVIVVGLIYKLFLLKPDDSETAGCLGSSLIIGAVVWLILIIVSYSVWKWIGLGVGLGLFWGVVFVLWPPVILFLFLFIWKITG